MVPGGGVAGEHFVCARISWSYRPASDAGKETRRKRRRREAPASASASDKGANHARLGRYVFDHRIDRRHLRLRRHCRRVVRGGEDHLLRGADLDSAVDCFRDDAKAVIGFFQGSWLAECAR